VQNRPSQETEARLIVANATAVTDHHRAAIPRASTNASVSALL
jgi:hypothetical protein